MTLVFYNNLINKNSATINLPHKQPIGSFRPTGGEIIAHGVLV